ncbi:MAG: PA14 domain-containing protein [Planctomycetota bacterium]|nr:PA14 domain-containing protein [Planctomycetota bacterium]
MAEQPDNHDPSPPARQGAKSSSGHPAAKVGKQASGASPRIKEIGGFELLGKIGQGGMGTVFRARQRSLDRIVALKILAPSIAKDAEFLERFQREARASAKLSHVNVVLGIDVGKDPATGLWYFAMELVDGPSLKQVLQEQRVVPERRALEIARQAAYGLECIARHGMVHRDIKPDNILLTSQGEAKLADLGLARQIRDDASLTQSGSTVGTPHYMAPEQVRGLKDKIDIRTDIYGLGATLFHLVTGRTPFDGPTAAAIMSRHLTEPVPKANRVNPEVSEGCSRLIEWMMQKKREDRIQTPAALLEQIGKVLKGEVTAARQPVHAAGHAASKRKRDTGPQKKTRSGGVVVALFLALVAAGTAAAYFGLPWKTEVASTELAPEKTDSGPSSAAPETAKKVAPTTPDAKGGEPPVVALGPKPGAKTPAEPEDTKKAIPAKADTKEDAAATGEPAATKKAAEKEEPDAAAKKEPGGREWGGFRGEYYMGEGLETLNATQEDQTINFKWPGGVPKGYAPRTGFSARWSGFVEPPQDGEYVFDVTSCAGSRLYLDTFILFDSWSGKGNTGKSLPVVLQKGKKYALRFELRNRGEDSPAVACLKWGLVGEPTQFVCADPPEAGDMGVPVGHLQGGWQAEYGKVGVEEPLVTRKELAIAWDWGGASPSPAVPVDKFWGRWTGLVVPPETSEYVFHVVWDEGVRLYINDMLLLDYMNLGPGKADSPPLQLEKGKSYLVRLEYLEWNEYASCALRWSCKAFTPTLVRAVGVGEPTGVLPNVGFLAEYGHSGTQTIVSRREILVNWNWKSGSPSPAINADKFWANYSGWITPPADGEYTFLLDYDDGARLFLDDVYLFDCGARGNTGEAVATLPPLLLKGGKHYALKLNYWENNEYARMRLLWRSKDIPKQPVPATIPEAIPENAKDVGHLECGVLAEYGAAKAPLIRRLEGRIVHDFERGAPGSDFPASGTFWGRWTGGLKVPVSGQYAFKLDAEATAEMRLAQQAIVKVPPPNWKPPRTATERAKPPTSAESPSLPLNKGQIYFLEVLLTSQRRGSDYPSYIKLLWKPPGKTEYEEVPYDIFVLPPQAREMARRPPAPAPAPK